MKGLDNEDEEEDEDNGEEENDENQHIDMNIIQRQQNMLQK